MNMVIAHCNDVECYVEGGLTLLFFFWHFDLMIRFMGLWAEGSTILILASLLFVLVALWNMALVMNWPGFLQMDNWIRTVPFYSSALYSLYYFTSVIAWIIMFKADTNRGDSSFEEIICAWLIWITTPTAFITIAYTINELYYTDDINLFRDDDRSGDDSDDDNGRGRGRGRNRLSVAY